MGIKASLKKKIKAVLLKTSPVYRKISHLSARQQQYSDKLSKIEKNLYKILNNNEDLLWSLINRIDYNEAKISNLNNDQKKRISELTDKLTDKLKRHEQSSAEIQASIASRINGLDRHLSQVKSEIEKLDRHEELLTDIQESINGIMDDLGRSFSQVKDEIGEAGKTSTIDVKDTVLIPADKGELLRTFNALIEERGYGRISEGKYYTKSRKLVIHGWYFPRSSYDFIDLLDKNGCSCKTSIIHYDSPRLRNEYRNISSINSSFYVIYNQDISEKDSFRFLVRKGTEILLEKNITIRNIDEEYKDIFSYQNENLELDDIREVNVLFRGENIFRLIIPSIENKTKIAKLLDEYDSDYLAQNTEIEIIDETRKTTYKKEANPDNPPMDGKFDADKLGFAQITDFDANYMKNNYYRNARDVDFLLKYGIPEKSDILDIGCIPPLFSALLYDKGYRNISIIDPNASTYRDFFQRKKIKYHDYSVFDKFDINEQFDVICMNEVLEHLAGDLIYIFEQISSLLKPGGLLMLTTPNLSSFQGLWGLLFSGSGLASKIGQSVYDQYQRVKDFSYFGHIREYTKKEITVFFEKMGYSLVQEQYDLDWRLKDKNKKEKIFYVMEELMPRERVFAKYLFKKND